MMTEMKPLKPLDSGVVLIVGTKASNFDYELRNHPRVGMWSSQQEHWTNKDMPSNTRAVFMTRFMGHAAFEKIVSEARKRHITIFNPMGTGTIVRQVKELLAIEAVRPQPTNESIIVHTGPKENEMTQEKGKLKALIPFLDFAHSNVDNARKLIARAKEMGIETTIGSLSQLAMVERKKQGAPLSPRAYLGVGRGKKSVTQQKVAEVTTELKHVDVGVEMLDNAIRDLQDMRQYFVAAMKENQELKARLKKFKEVFEGVN